MPISWTILQSRRQRDLLHHGRRQSGLFTGFHLDIQTFAFQLIDQAKLVRLSPTSYEMTFRDGMRLVFGHPDGGLPLRRCFLTEPKDPAGNAVVLKYDF